uniref:Uncharacterized protein n=1 Tax=Arion vulgaris TaxID=1028688 RepID=A0A0B7B553_9EUPU
MNQNASFKGEKSKYLKQSTAEIFLECLGQRRRGIYRDPARPEHWVINKTMSQKLTYFGRSDLKKAIMEGVVTGRQDKGTTKMTVTRKS